ncbi:helix-turn-helix transcriptional regulator [Mycobacterium sp. CBMA293]|nr:helix-turn-helix transcriptional regulator [Mycolicibacterium sp. CBMA 360]MUL61366.1 helix-turn-helix transcriptional regulator [Mycolicibacterium sp. CBMA 335]MUL72101.1 helix-turn-helix transcriptional regulator [Mycolicibacterium sp. CBMA 311]MUL96268.1 helix-turn-helix transcriptional regulator [Mycolicibacterium sp. CBMA 230]MUM13578.1 helix-turn-helix transcriptional regulator [Mycolicibacterium sp. CBMA 293]MUM34071.1 helix-turn-helix transcriptional regulator [Mycolicibacterium sp.
MPIFATTAAGHPQQNPPPSPVRSSAPFPLDYEHSRRMIVICATLWRHFARRQVLAAQAASGLAELGFARASMRELARHCWISLGVLHYYFVD